MTTLCRETLLASQLLSRVVLACNRGFNLSHITDLANSAQILDLTAVQLSRLPHAPNGISGRTHRSPPFHFQRIAVQPAAYEIISFISLVGKPCENRLERVQHHTDSSLTHYLSARFPPSDLCF